MKPKDAPGIFLVAAVAIGLIGGTVNKVAFGNARLFSIDIRPSPAADAIKEHMFFNARTVDSMPGGVIEISRDFQLKIPPGNGGNIPCWNKDGSVIFFRHGTSSFKNPLTFLLL